MKSYYSVILLLSSFLSLSQVGIGTTTPNAALDIEATDDGLLIPRIALTATNVATVTTPTESELVYNTATAGIAPYEVTPGFYYWDGVQWVRVLMNTNNNWSIDGNDGTDPTTNFLGTIDNQDLVIRTNNTENVRVNTDGNVGIGTTSNAARLYVNLPNTDTTTNYGIYNYFDGADAGTTYGIRNHNYGSGNGTKYGFYNNVNNEGAGGRYGIYNNVNLNSTSNASGYGIRNSLYTYGSGTQFGIYNYVSSSSATGIHYGQRNFLYLASTSTADAYGEYTYVDYSSGSRYGEYKTLNSNATFDGDVYGDYNDLYGSGDGNNFGVYNEMSASGTGAKYGVYNDMSGVNGTKYGMRNEFADTAGTKYGVYNYFPSGTAIGTIYGTYNSIQNDANATKYGTYNYISGGDGALRGSYNSVYPAATNSSTIHGVYGYVSSVGTGVHYGGYFSAYGDNNRAVYGTNTHVNGWAGYFIGNGYWDGNMIFNESGIPDHDFTIQSDTRDHMFWLDSNENLVRFGSSSAGSDFGNGSTVSGTVVDYVADFDNMLVAGTAVGIGSVEYFLDLTNETTINNYFSPTVDNTYDLGSATLRWNDVYATNGTIVTSDRREKEQIVPMEYGLKEIMQLKPVTYKWKRNRIGNTTLSNQDKELKLGLIAQEVQQVLPEVVQTHNWRALSEENPNNYTKVPMERLGMSYHEIVPVLIKAMQEQTEIIEKQNSEIDELRREMQEIKRLLQSR